MGEIYSSLCKNCIEEEKSNQIEIQPKKNFRNLRKSKILEKNDSFNQKDINDNENFDTNYQNNYENEYDNGNKDEKKIKYEKADMDKLCFINKMISCPDDYQRDASERKNDIVDHFEKRIEEREKNNEFVNVLNMDTNLRNLVLNYLLDKKNNDKQNSEKEKDIENIISQNNNNQKVTIKLFLQIICDITDSVEENVWKILEENPDNVYDILKKYEEIVIVTIPLNEKQIITYYFFYNFN